MQVFVIDLKYNTLAVEPPTSSSYIYISDAPIPLFTNRSDTDTFEVKIEYPILSH